MIKPISTSISLLLISGVLTSCSSVVRTHAIENDAGNRIIFVNMKISRDKSGVDIIELVSKSWADGQIKETNQAMVPKGELLVCEFLDKNKKVLSSVTLENPLTASVEEYSPDGSIKRVEPKLERSYFSVRAAVSSKTVQLRVSNEKDKVMGTFDLL